MSPQLYESIIVFTVGCSFLSMLVSGICLIIFIAADMHWLYTLIASISMVGCSLLMLHSSIERGIIKRKKETTIVSV
jgi:hypothetical protein